MVVILKQRYRIALACALAIFSLLAFVPLGKSVNPVAVMTTMDAGHAFAFCLLSWLLYRVVAHHGRFRAVMISALASVVLMVGIEFLQPYFGRTSSLADIKIDLLGSAIALSGIVAWHCLNSRLLRGAHLLLAIFVFGWVAYPAWNEWRSIWLREQQFPVLGGFENSLEKRLWKSSGITNGMRTKISFSDKHAVSGRYSLKIETLNGTWSGVSFSAGEQDWRGYHQLVMSIYNPDDTFMLNVRIDDEEKHSPQYHERYNGRFQVSQGNNTLLIPLEKIANYSKNGVLNMARIRKMVLFLGVKETSRLFYLDGVQLILDQPKMATDQ